MLRRHLSWDGHLTAPPGPDEGESQEEDHDARPDVDPDAEDLVGGVAAHQLEDDPTHRITDDVEAEELALAQRPTAIDKNEDEGQQQAPERLVEEGRLEGAE